MPLDEYRHKRKFPQTPEPPGREVGPAPGGNRFVVQMHQARQLHFDFRLEIEGTLKSWAVPKGPTLDPAQKRLAMRVEDHPVEYLDFEGTIPTGNYGAGTVLVWDLGAFEPASRAPQGTPDSPAAMLERGDLKFLLHGKKLQGEFALVHMKSRRPGSKGNEWLLLKKKDAHASPGWDPATFDRSVLSGRTLAEIAADAGSAVWESGRQEQTRAGKWRPKARSKPPAASAPAWVEAKPALEPWPAAGQRPALVLAKAASLPGAQAAPMPSVIRPMLAASPAETRPAQGVPALVMVEGDDWLLEIKWDGVRAIAYVEDGKLRLVSRNLRDISAHYPDLAQLPHQVQARRAILDGEIVCLEESGRASFERLQQRMNLRAPDSRAMAEFPVVYYAFDLLYLDGYDLRQAPLEKRKELLRALLRPDDRLRYSDHHVGEGALLFRLAQERGLEGILAKRRRSPYREERSDDWVKIKATRRQECVVCGWTDPRGSRRYFGALILGLFRGKELVFVGSAGSGFDQQTQERVWKELEALPSARRPFSHPPETNEKPHWVEPRLVAEIKFSEWTSEGRMRAPVFLGLRQDKSPEDCLWEDVSSAEFGVRNAESETDPSKAGRRARSADSGSSFIPHSALRTPHSEGLFHKRAGEETVEVEGRRMHIQNLDKVFFPGDGYTKADLVEYYFRIAPYLLPHMHDRPVVMKRHPNGIDKPYFFQKEAGAAMPGWVRTESLPSSHGSRQTIHYVICNDRATLVYLANLACIDQNLWMSRLGSLDHPDFVLFDLDPGEGAGYEAVVEVAVALRKILSNLKLAAYPKTSGASGLHVYVPLEPVYSYEQSRSFAEVLSRVLAHQLPRLITQERSIARRPQNRVYLDWLQNGWGKTIPPPYSVRPRPGAPVSTPLEWNEVKPGLDPRDFTIRTIWARLKARGDLFEGTITRPQRLETAVERLQGLLP